MTKVRVRKKSDFEKAMEMVNKPSHYTQGKYELIDVLRETLSREKFIGGMEVNIQRYMRRWDSKGIKPEMTENEKNLVKYINLSKAEFYLKELMRLHLPEGVGIPEHGEMDVDYKDSAS